METYRNSPELWGWVLDDPMIFSTYKRGPRDVLEGAKVASLPPQAATPPPDLKP